MVDANEDYYLEQIQNMLKNKTYSLTSNDYTMFKKNDKEKIREWWTIKLFRLEPYCEKYHKEVIKGGKGKRNNERST